MPGGKYDQALFHTPGERCRRLTTTVLRYVDPDAAAMVLDIGCGTGDQILDLADSMQSAHFIGVDISDANIGVARRRWETSRHADRIAFYNSDYMGFEPDRAADVVFSYSTLHLIATSSEELFGKISRELRPGGLLINVMPIRCPYNTVLTVVRRLLRASRGRLTDWLILTLGHFVHGSEIPREALRERVLYMYEIPKRFDGPALHRLLRKSFGLEPVVCLPEVHASPAQMKHSICIFRKATGGG